MSLPLHKQLCLTALVSVLGLATRPCSAAGVNFSFSRTGWLAISRMTCRHVLWRITGKINVKSAQVCLRITRMHKTGHIFQPLVLSKL